MHSQASWRVYVESFGYEFQQWDMHESGELGILGAPPPRPRTNMWSSWYEMRAPQLKILGHATLLRHPLCHSY